MTISPPLEPTPAPIKEVPMSRYAHPAPPSPPPLPDEDRRCVDCGVPCTEQVASIPRLQGGTRGVYACSVHAAQRRAAL
jgi:hypothetical protein